MRESRTITKSQYRFINWCMLRSVNLDLTKNEIDIGKIIFRRYLNDESLTYRDNSEWQEVLNNLRDKHLDAYILSKK